MENGMKTAVLDTCILSLGEADPMHCFREDPPDGFFKNKILIYKLKENIDTEKLIIRQAIGRAARHGVFSVHLTHEIEIENMNGLQSLISNASPLYAFQHIPWGKTLESPIERGKFFQTFNFMKGCIAQKFTEFLLDCNALYLIDMMHKQRGKFTDFEIHCAENLDRFRYLCRDDVLHRKRARDVFHFWTAECHGMDFFITSDMKLYNSYTNAVRQGKLTSKTEMVTPKEFLTRLSIRYDDIRLPEAGRKYSLLDVMRFNISKK